MFSQVSDSVYVQRARVRNITSASAAQDHKYIDKVFAVKRRDNMGAFEYWLFRRDGRLYLHTETDGPRILRHGIERWEREITEAEARRSYPELLEQLEQEEATRTLEEEVRHQHLLSCQDPDCGNPDCENRRRWYRRLGLQAIPRAT
jgi:hypothetical protein